MKRLMLVGLMSCVLVGQVFCGNIEQFAEGAIDSSRQAILYGTGLGLAFGFLKILHDVEGKKGDRSRDDAAIIATAKAICAWTGGFAILRIMSECFIICEGCICFNRNFDKTLAWSLGVVTGSAAILRAMSS